MVRPRIELDPYKDEITALFNQQKSNEDICLDLARLYAIEITPRTLRRRLQQWGLLRTKRIDDPILCERIRSLVCDNLSDKEILLTLHREGFQISQDTLRKLRQKLGLRRRTDNPEAQRLQEDQMREILQQEIQDGSIEGYGRGLLHTHLRQKGYLFPR